MLANVLKKLLPPKFFAERSVTQQQIVLFLFVGGLNTLFGYSSFALFIYLGFHYAIAAALGTCLGVLFNFMTTGKMVFDNLKIKLIFKFISIYGFMYCLNVTLLKMLQCISTNYYLTGFIVIFPMAAISFTLNKYFVFKRAT